MKKHYSKILMVLLIVVILFAALAGCKGKDVEKTDTADIAAFATKLREADSFTVELMGVVKEYESTEIKGIYKFDGNKEYSSGLYVTGQDPEESYRGIFENKGYNFSFDFRSYLWFYTIDEDIDYFKRNMAEFRESGISLLNHENFEYSIDKQAFIVKSGKSVNSYIFDHDIIHDVLTMVLTANQAVITFIMDMGDWSANMTITFKDINNTTIALPKDAIEDKRGILSEYTNSFYNAESFTAHYKGIIDGKNVESLLKIDRVKMSLNTKYGTEIEDMYIAEGINGVHAYYHEMKEDSKWYYSNIHAIEGSYLDGFKWIENYYKQDLRRILRSWNYQYSVDKNAFVLMEGYDLGALFGFNKLSDLTLVIKDNSAVISFIIGNTEDFMTITISAINSTKITLPENATERLNNSIELKNYRLVHREVTSSTAVL